MRRTKAWWAALSRQERVELVALERSANRGGRSSYIPDDCSECGLCGTPSLGGGLCPLCRNRLTSLVAKADEAMGATMQVAKHYGEAVALLLATQKKGAQ